MSDTGPANPRRVAKVGHRKSRNGCTKCKTRRVKCNEARPVCSNCQRLGLDCSWPPAKTPPIADRAAPAPAAPSAPAAPAAPSAPAAIPTARLPPYPAAHSALIPPVPPPPKIIPSNPLPIALPSASSTAPIPCIPSQMPPGEKSASRGFPLPHSPASTRSSSAPESAVPVNDALLVRASNDSRDDQAKATDHFAAILRTWSSTTNHKISCGIDESGDDAPLPESRARRLLEHRLMLNFLQNLSLPFSQAPSPDWQEVWTKRLPPMALKYDNILYALLAHSATHLLSEEPDNKELFNIRQTYLISAIREQRKMIETLTLESADAVCMSSILILINAFALLDERVLEPYVPPIEWLELGRGSGAFIWMSVGAIVDSGEVGKSVMYTIATSQPKFGFDESYFDAANRDHLDGLLAQNLPSGDVWDDETRDVYEKTLAYVGSIQKSIIRGEPVYVVCRRIQGFTMVVPPKFVDFVSERRPRALVILAHFFAACSQISGIWWLGCRDGDSISKKELRGIRSVLPQDWQGHMIWPLDTAGIIDT